MSFDFSKLAELKKYINRRKILFFNIYKSYFGCMFMWLSQNESILYFRRCLASSLN